MNLIPGTIAANTLEPPFVVLDPLAVWVLMADEDNFSSTSTGRDRV